MLGDDFGRPLAFAERVRASGAGIDALYLGLLSPTARYFGDLWNEDLLDFTQVTIGLGRLHRVLRELTPMFPVAAGEPPQEHRALLVPVPGEQHTFGLAMVTEFFRRACWAVWSGTPANGAELGAIVRDNWFAIVGFSLGSELRLSELRTSIGRVRRISRNRNVGIMVGGPAFVEHPELVAQVGADAMAVDGRQAVTQAQSLLSLLSLRA